MKSCKLIFQDFWYLDGIIKLNNFSRNNLKELIFKKTINIIKLKIRMIVDIKIRFLKKEKNKKRPK